MPRTSSIALIERAARFAGRIAIADAAGTHSYRALLDASARIAGSLVRQRGDLAEDRVAFLCPPTFDYPAAQWGIWRAGGVAVPLATMHPPAELEHVLQDAEISAVIVHETLRDRVQVLADRLRIPLLTTGGARAGPPAALPDVARSRRAMMLYTSGTTAGPKGVVTTHGNIEAQVRSLVEAWEWAHDDHILGVLPLHHVHGVVAVLTSALWSGARCELAERFDAQEVWQRLASGEPSLFMAVPTIYAKLIAAWRHAPPAEQAAISAGCAGLRLTVSGSAALPVTVLQDWRRITGHVLLERYGMTEIGMALSNPYRGRRLPGHVGTPLPGVEVRLIDEGGSAVAAGTSGEIEVRGDGVFLEYWRHRVATRAAFRDGGWFRTGDVAVMEDGSCRILGRASIDIIKTGGYKVSALEIEEVLRSHRDIEDCAVVGVADPEWGERVAACVTVAAGEQVALADLRAWGRERLASYKLPSLLRVVDALPRNALGKVTKPAVRRLFTPVGD